MSDVSSPIGHMEYWPWPLLPVKSVWSWILGIKFKTPSKNLESHCQQGKLDISVWQIVIIIFYTFLDLVFDYPTNPSN